MISRCALSAVLFACFIAVLGQQVGAATYKHPLSDLPPGGDILVNHFFPDHPVTKFPAGLPVKIVAGIHNDATTPYNISAIMGSINFPHDFSQHIQNFTQQLYFVMLPGGKEISLDYTFRPDRLLGGRDFQLALTVFYEDTKGGFFSTTFFNSTVDFTEIEKIVDTEAIFLYLLMAGVIVVAGFYAYKSFAGATGMKIKTKSKPKVKSEAVKADESDDWLKGTNYDPKRKAAKAAAKKTT